MINRNALVTAIVSTFAAICLPVTAAEQGDVIKSFNTTLIVHKDAEILVDEKIDVDFGKNQHHGIIRMIPVEGMIHNEKMSCRIQPLKAYVDGAETSNAVSYDSFNNCVFKVGSSNIVLQGKHSYEIKYNVRGAVRLAGEKPEVCWNATGNAWLMPIESAQATIIVPEGVDASHLKAQSFVGAQMATDHSKMAHKAKSIVFETGKLNPGQGMTIAVQFPEKSVEIPGLIAQWLWDLEQAALVIGGIVFFCCGLVPLALLMWGFAAVRNALAESAGWDTGGGSSTDFGFSGGGFGGGGGDFW